MAFTGGGATDPSPEDLCARAGGLYGAPTIMHEAVILAEAKQAGAEMYLSSFPLVGHRGP